MTIDTRQNPLHYSIETGAGRPPGADNDIIVTPDGRGGSYYRFNARLVNVTQLDPQGELIGVIVHAKSLKLALEIFEAHAAQLETRIADLNDPYKVKAQVDTTLPDVDKQRIKKFIENRIHVSKTYNVYIDHKEDDKGVPQSSEIIIYKRTRNTHELKHAFRQGKGVDKKITLEREKLEYINWLTEQYKANGLPKGEQRLAFDIH
jgi:hypothetical protein